MAVPDSPPCPLCGKGMEALIAAWRCSCGAVMRRIPVPRRETAALRTAPGSKA